MNLMDLQSIPLETLRREVALQDSLHHSLLRNIELKSSYPKADETRQTHGAHSSHARSTENRHVSRRSHSPHRRRRQSRSRSPEPRNRDRARRRKSPSPTPRRESKDLRQKAKSSKRKLSPAQPKRKVLKLNEQCVSSSKGPSRTSKPSSTIQAGSSRAADNCQYLPIHNQRAQEVEPCNAESLPQEQAHEDDYVDLNPILDRSLENALFQDEQVAMLLSPNIVPQHDLIQYHHEAEALMASAHQQVTDPKIPDGLPAAINDVIKCHGYNSLDMDGEQGIFHFPPDQQLPSFYDAQAQSMAASATVSSNKHPVQPPLLHWTRRTGEPSLRDGCPPTKQVSRPPDSLFGLVSDRAAKKSRSPLLQIPIQGAMSMELSTRHAIQVNRTQSLFAKVIDDEAVVTNVKIESLLEVTPEISVTHEVLLQIRESTLKLQRAREQIQTLQNSALEHLVFAHSVLEVARRNKFLADNPLKGLVSKESKDTLICSTLGSDRLFSEEATAQAQAQFNVSAAAGYVAHRINSSNAPASQKDA